MEIRERHIYRKKGKFKISGRLFVITIKINCIEGTKNMTLENVQKIIKNAESFYLRLVPFTFSLNFIFEIMHFHMFVVILEKYYIH